MDRAAQGAGGIHAPVMYRLTGDNDYDRLFMAEVVKCGEGQIVRDHAEVFVVHEGDILMMNLCNVSYRLHLDGKPFWMVQNRFIAGVLDPETFIVRPVQHWILVKADAERAARSVNPGRIWIPGEGGTDHVDHDRGLHVDFGEVVDVGPGRWFEGDWLAPNCSVGDWILYDKSHSTLPVTIRGESMTLVSATQVVLVEPSARQTLPAVAA